MTANKTTASSAPTRQNSTISRVWVEHTKVGMWFYVCSNVVVDGCRIRDTLADGINLCVDTRNMVVQNCTTRGTGDDCFAMWPTASDQGFVQQTPMPGSNVFRHCTGQLPFLANGGAIYGGANNCIEDCLFKDISPGCGILISSTFPTADESLKVDNNFSGTTVVRNCDLIRCGGYDHDWAWRAAFQICMDRRSISGLEISNVNIMDSLSDGFSMVGAGQQTWSRHAFQCPSRRREHSRLRNRNRLAAWFVDSRGCLRQPDPHQLQNCRHPKQLDQLFHHHEISGWRVLRMAIRKKTSCPRFMRLSPARYRFKLFL